MHRRLSILLLPLLVGAGFWWWQTRIPRQPTPLPPAIAQAAVAVTPAIAVSLADAAATTAPAQLAANAATSHSASIADILAAAGDLSDPVIRARVVAAIRQLEGENLAAAEALASLLGQPTRVVLPDGRIRQLVGMEDGRLLYHVTENLNAAISAATDLAQAAPSSLSGVGVTIGLWEAGGMPRLTHQEFGGRVTPRQTGMSMSDHATHVAGTMIAAGINSAARGMAPEATIDAYDSTNANAELTASGAAQPEEAGKLYLSNHSYGGDAGWESSANNSWTWYGTGTTATAFDENFGRYNTSRRDTDAVAYALPYLLMVRSGGNHRNDGPNTGDTVYLSSTSTTPLIYNPALHPPGDGVYRGGYDTLRLDSIAKNVLSVGAVADAVTGGARDLAKATQASFSSWGPTDDGRIKPDLVANGVSLTSSTFASDTSYGSKGGTSMAAPSVTGSAALLVQLYRRLFPGGAMRASTLKGLLIHTADDLENPGPDYISGWGMLNTMAAAHFLRDHAAHPGKSRLSERQLTTTVTTETHEFRWDGTSPIRVTLCWTDPSGPGLTGADNRTATLRNNLDLRLIAPNDTTHLPYVMPFVGTWTQASLSENATTGVNNTDNVEQVYLAAPSVAGVYQAVISYQGTLTNHAQIYSLLIDGAQNPSLNFADWAQSFGLTGNNAQANADPDADGLPNAAEFVLGGNPTLADAAAIMPTFTFVNHGATLRFTRTADSVGRATINVQTSTDLVAWTDFATLGDAQTGLVTILIPAHESGRQFVRLRVVLP
ncbi:MAG: S8 family serine peptidase [Candidatus Didemnitutus sp.]|nr:S8 family serine peptidase [Candidatus Didemnitutus sp.]